MEIDATDQLERGDSIAGSMGVYPDAGRLEMLLYPKSALVIANEVLLNIGVIEVIPPEAPLTLFVWGVNRILPVRLTELSITEEAYDPNLNPIRAKVSLGLRVLNYHDLGLLSVGGTLFMAHQIAKEVMATIGSVGNIAGGCIRQLQHRRIAMFEPTSRYATHRRCDPDRARRRAGGHA